MRVAALLMALILGAGPVMARAPVGPLSNEARTAAYLDHIADSPPRLRIFLQAMPKGGDLHNHAGGANFAEDYLRWAAADGLCIATDSYHIVDPPCDAPGRIAAAGLERDYPHYSRAIDAFSTRGFEAGVGDPMVSGYDRFFATFDAFGAAYGRHVGEAMALTRQQAAADHISYVELGSGARAGWLLGLKMADADASDFAALYARIAPLLLEAVASARADYDRYEAEGAAIDGCGTATPRPACGVEIRYLYTAIRTNPPAQVFAQLTFGFALAEADPRFVGVNIAAPEHDPVAVRDYALHMAMIAFLKARHPTVKLSLHAGELTLGLVPSRDLAFHIRDAVEIAGARRIGHGIDITYETDAPSLLARMARDRIAVEINLTSNAVILGVKGRDHPLSLYRAAGVPVVLSTDDEGVSRSDMTNEYLRAVTEQGLRYADLKQIVRDGLHYSFLPGASLWQDRAGGARVAACAIMDAPGCKAWLAGSPKATSQAKLERELEAFEAMPR
ncbi:adenosine deaminase [Sphingobium sp. BYY-5]|uniref:adenosine deaminase family protein n=1 Tax=Sphingobium sp. BYY-5 TaxID=2926400 RepID=UPI001FA73D81|nr:adenosine deaminase [Sphingobium sp. BYY-5]MCI4592570.1 adenosine deaminase [Sphingobium sp. BYY-5]